MASFKLTIADPKEGKSYQKEVKDAEADGFLGLNIGESIMGESFGLDGYECEITGGSDFCGFPMRKGILGVRKKITSIGGVGFPGLKGGKKLRRTVCGHKINDNITQVNIKVTKTGAKKLADAMGAGESVVGAAEESKDKEEAPAKVDKVEKPGKAQKEAPEDKVNEKPTEGSAEVKPKEEASAKVDKVEKPGKAQKDDAPKED